jgi:integrase
MVRAWGEENAGVELGDYTREQAREYGLKYPARVKFLRAMWNDALRDGLIDGPRDLVLGTMSPPTNSFAALRIAKPRKERYFPSTEEVQALIRAAQEPLRGRIRFSAYTGLRLGEMLAVRPEDFDDEKFRVQVREQINPSNKRVPRKGKIKDYWALVVAPAIGGHLGLLEGVAWEERLWPLTRAEHNKEWNALRRAQKLPENFVWHSLRHHAATWFLDQGASFEDVAIQLGHSDEGVQVRDTYGHRDRDKALDRLEAVVSG